MINEQNLTDKQCIAGLCSISGDKLYTLAADYFLSMGRVTVDWLFVAVTIAALSVQSSIGQCTYMFIHVCYQMTNYYDMYVISC